MSNTPESVVIYCRVSSRKQVETGNWLDSQLQICKEWIKKQNGEVELVKVFEDGWVSWKYESREWLDTMIAYLQEENKNYTKITRVIVDDIDRIIRDVAWRWNIKTKIEDLGWAKIFSLKQDINDTPEGKMLQSITMSVKQYERENNARRTRDRQRWRMMNWYWCFTAQPWYEYQHEDNTNKRGWKVLVLTQPNASILQEWFELLAKGVLVKMTDFVNFLNSNWFKTKSGKKLRAWSYTDALFTKDKLLFFAWYISFPERDLSMIPARHEPLITLDMVEKILEKTDPARKKKYTLIAKEKYNDILPLRGCLCCEECHKSMTWSPSRGKLWTIYFYYTCRNKGCSKYGKSFNSNTINQVFEQHLEKYCFEEKYTNLFKDVMTNVRENSEYCSKLANDDNRVKLEKIDKEISTIVDRIFSATNDKLRSIY